MIALVSYRSPDEDASRSQDQSRSSWFTRVWVRIVEWLMEPIPFPGKWPVRELGVSSYNNSKEADLAASELPADAANLSHE